MAKPTRRRVYLFITRPNDGLGQILVRGRAEPLPGEEVETPGGTVEQGESPAAAAVREATEETGLTRFGPTHLLAEDEWENEDERLQRSFFQLPILEPTDDAWTHRDAAEGKDHGVEFLLRWVDLPGAGDLAPHFRAYLDKVRIGPAQGLPTQPDGVGKVAVERTIRP